MRIQHNIAALNANRMLASNNDKVSKNLEKLSSGYKINRAGDDAAGLAISEKMRGQIRGLDQASNNANDGISLVQTAEGSLNETASILQRMKELATQASNGTYQNSVDRDNISKEVESLKSEVSRISTSTNFNKINLLDGSLGGYGITPDAANPAYNSKGLTSISIEGGNLTTSDTFTVTDTAGVFSVTTSADAKAGFSLSAATVSEDGKTLTYKVKMNDTASVADAKQYNGVTITVKKGSEFDATASGTYKLDIKSVSTGLKLQIGASATDDQQVTLKVGDMSAKGLGIDALTVDTQDNALKSISAIDDAINKVSGTRADLGALQNRLEHTVTNLGTTSENLTSAESRIRDVDMAKEMMEMTKNNVLTQAAQSMLAQANTQPQNVLKLLQ